VPCGKPELVDPVDVLGIGHGDAEAVADERERDGNCALEHAQLDHGGRVGRDARLRQVDDRQAAAAGDRTRDALGLGVAVLEERLGEGTASGATARGGNPVGGEQLGGGEEVGDELGDGVQPRRVGRGRADRDPAGGWRLGAIARERDGSQKSLGVEAHFPRTRYRQIWPNPLAPVGDGHVPGSDPGYRAGNGPRR